MNSELLIELLPTTPLTSDLAPPRYHSPYRPPTAHWTSVTDPTTRVPERVIRTLIVNVLADAPCGTPFTGATIALALDILKGNCR